MARLKPEFRLRTWGLYTQWDSAAKDIPSIVEVTTRVPAVVDVEFGFVLNVRRGRTAELQYCIDHPGILDDSGQRRPPFTGSVFVKTSDWDFFLGDTIWKPLSDKLGDWHLTVRFENRVVAEKTFQIYR
ncbi:MAG: DUF3859 domain-containing protein [Planctomycetaceae bacterium]|nr:DUF3859 domain-containing protein [Planctomycetaceae bacterium]